jgi:DNA-binding NtrC family response regulator
LRERSDDVIPLAQRFLRQCEEGRPLTLSRAVVVLLNEYHYPGNVRELRNVIADAALRCTGPELLARHVLPRLDADIAVSDTRRQTDQEALYSLPLKDAAVRLEQEYCRKYLPWILESCNNNLTQAASKAGIDPKTFRRKWEECGLEKLSTR